MRSREAQLQSECVKWFQYAYPKLAKLLFAVPNGGSRNAIEARNLKLQGVISGVSDLILLISRSGFNSLCIEMKAGNGKQTENQVEWQKESEREGNKYVVCRSFDEFKSEIDKYILDAV